MGNLNHQTNGKFGPSKKVEVECAVCGKKRIRTIDNIKGKKKFYCSYKCQRSRGSEQKVRKICPQCKREFISYVSQNKEYCSKDCYTNSGRKEYVCVVCGKKFIKKRCYEKGDVKYCSRECFFRDIKENDNFTSYWKSLEGKQPKNMEGLKLGRLMPPWNKGLTKEMDKRLIQTKEQIRKKLRRREMSSLEVGLDDLIKKNGLPYKFVGNGKFFIERKNPDFINTNGVKLAVEVFDSRHKKIFRGGTDSWKQERNRIFTKYGWSISFIEKFDLIYREDKVLSSLEKGVAYHF